MADPYNIIFLVISCLGFTSAILDVSLGLGSRAKLLAQSADIIEFAISKYCDGKLSDDDFLKKIDQIIEIRQSQHESV